MNQDSMDRGTAVFTIVAKNYLPQARVLMRSIADCHPDWRRYVFLADRIDGHLVVLTINVGDQTAVDRRLRAVARIGAVRR